MLVTQLPLLPRMADFAVWSSACESAYWSTGHFLNAFNSMSAASNRSVIEASTVGRAIIALMDTTTQWRGTMSELQIGLEALASDLDRRAIDWPGSAESLGREVDRLTPDLRALGIDVSKRRTSRERQITLTRSDREKR